MVTFTTLQNSLPFLFKGLQMTIFLWIGASLLSLLIGVAAGFIQSRRYARPWLSRVVNLYLLVMRGIPLYVQILMVYFALPALIGLRLSPAVAGIVALGLCSGAYLTEIVRGGINAIPDGQWEAAYVLGYSPKAQIRRILMPQLLTIVFPSLVNELVSVLKSTSLLAAIGALELTKVGINIIAREMDPVPVYLAIGLMYMLLTGVATLAAARLERMLTYGR